MNVVERKSHAHVHVMQNTADDRDANYNVNGGFKLAA
jgi:hypothetical protein